MSEAISEDDGSYVEIKVEEGEVVKISDVGFRGRGGRAIEMARVIAINRMMRTTRVRGRVANKIAVRAESDRGGESKHAKVEVCCW